MTEAVVQRARRLMERFPKALAYLRASEKAEDATRREAAENLERQYTREEIGFMLALDAYHFAAGRLIDAHAKTGRGIPGFESLKAVDRTTARVAQLIADEARA